MSGPPWAALWTPCGRGAIATIRLSVAWQSWPPLDDLPFRAANGRPLSAQSVGRVIFGHWGTGPEEEVVLCAVDRQSIEIHCHGGEAAPQRILRDLARASCRVVTWSEAIREIESPLRAEIMGDLCHATTLRTAAILWEQANGAFESSVRDLKALAVADPSASAAQIREWLSWTEFGLHLMRPWSVVLAGRPNVGKSSLINALLGYTRSVVFDQPGTTRDVVSAQTAVDGWPIELFDTAGLRESDDPLESAGIERARQSLEAADLAMILIDASQPASPADRSILARYPDALGIAHKCDLPIYEGQGQWEPRESDRWLRVSSKTGAGIETLVAAISRSLVPRVPLSDALVPTTERQVSLLRRALEAAERSAVAAALRSLEELIAGAGGSPADQTPSAKRKGSPATS